MAYLYREIFERIYYEIKNGKIAAGDVLPGEEKLAAQFGVSRITAMRALNELCARGLVKRIKHKGTVVLAQEDVVLPNRVDDRYVAVVFPHFDEYGTRFMTGMKTFAFERKLNLSFFNSRQSPKIEREILSKLAQEPLSGLVLMPTDDMYNVDILADFMLRKVPIAFMDLKMKGIKKPCIFSDNFAGMFELTDYLIKCNHTRIGFFNLRRPVTTPEIDRFNGFCHCMIRHGIPLNRDYLYYYDDLPTHHRNEDELNAQVWEGARRIAVRLEQPDRPTAIACMNDHSAGILIRAVRESGLRVPEDLSVTGFDNTSISRDYDLTTVAQDFGKIGQIALEAILNQQKAYPPPFKIRKLPRSCFRAVRSNGSETIPKSA